MHANTEVTIAHVKKLLSSAATIVVLERKEKMVNEAKKYANHLQLLDHQKEFNFLFHQDS